MRIRTEILALTAVLAATIPSTVHAQDEEGAAAEEPADEELVPKDELIPKDEDPNAQAEAEEAAAEEPVQAVEEEQATQFEVRRGLFARGDFGLLFNFGGTVVDRNTQQVSDKTVSNLQPLIGFTFGYDVFTNTNNNLAIGARLAAAFNSGSGQADVDAANAGQSDLISYPEDYAMYQAGIAVDYTYMFTEQLGLQIHADGGLGVTTPDPDQSAKNGPATNPETGNFNDDAGGASLGVMFSAGAGVEYATRLPGLIVGFNAAFYGVTTTDSFIPGLGLYVPLKYNF